MLKPVTALLAFSVCLFAGGEVPPAQQVYQAFTQLTYFDPQPAGLIDITETFNDTANLTQYTESAPGTVAAAGNQLTITHAGGGAKSTLEAITASTYTMPQAFVSIRITAKGTLASGYDVVGIGLEKDANNYAMACFDKVANSAKVCLKIAGTITNLGSVAYTLPAAPFDIGFSLVANSACVWVKPNAGTWSVITKTTVAAQYDYRTIANLAGWKAGLIVSTSGNTAWTFATLKTGRFGGVGMRDMTVVTTEDGTPYFNGSTLTFTATAADPNGLSATNTSSYAGIFTLDMLTHAIVQTGVFMVERAGKIYNDHDSHIIRYPNGDRRVTVTTFGSGFGGTLQILHGLLQSGDILAGTTVLSGLSALNLPLGGTGVGAVGAMLAYDADNTRWLLGYGVTDNTGWGTYGPFYVGTAHSADLVNWTGIGLDNSVSAFEGAKLLHSAGHYWMMANGPSSGVRQARIYEANTMVFSGVLTALFPAVDAKSPPHPMVFAYGSKYYVLTFNNQPYGGVEFTWGQPSLQEAARYFADLFRVYGSIQ